MLWSMHLGRAAGMSRSSRARYQPRFESLENRLTPTTGMLSPLIGGAPLEMPVIAAEAPSDNAASPSDNGTVGAEEPPLIVGGDGSLPGETNPQASEMPPEAVAPLPPPAPPVAEFEVPAVPPLPPVGQFELPPERTNEMPPDIVHWGADEIVPTPSIPAVSIGEAASGFGELAPTVVFTPTVVAPVSVTVVAPVSVSTSSARITTRTDDAALNFWLPPSTTPPLSLVTYQATVVDQVFTTPTQPVATTAKSTAVRSDLFGVGGEVATEPAETDLLAPATRVAKAKPAVQHEAEVEEELAVA